MLLVMENSANFSVAPPHLAGGRHPVTVVDVLPPQEVTRGGSVMSIKVDLYQDGKVHLPPNRNEMCYRNSPMVV